MPAETFPLGWDGWFYSRSAVWPKVTPESTAPFSLLFFGARGKDDGTLGVRSIQPRLPARRCGAAAPARGPAALPGPPAHKTPSSSPRKARQARPHKFSLGDQSPCEGLALHASLRGAGRGWGGAGRWGREVHLATPYCVSPAPPRPRGRRRAGRREKAIRGKC